MRQTIIKAANVIERKPLPELPLIVKARVRVAQGALEIISGGLKHDAGLYAVDGNVEEMTDRMAWAKRIDEVTQSLAELLGEDQRG